MWNLWGYDRAHLLRMGGNHLGKRHLPHCTWGWSIAKTWGEQGKLWFSKRKHAPIDLMVWAIHFTVSEHVLEGLVQNSLSSMGTHVFPLSPFLSGHYWAIGPEICSLKAASLQDTLRRQVWLKSGEVCKEKQNWNLVVSDKLSYLTLTVPLPLELCINNPHHYPLHQ